MEKKHTPGPWDYGEDRLGRKRVFAQNREIVRALSRHGNRTLSKTERDANANLIAAAPELLAMLKMAQLWLDVDGRYDMQGINAAIAKAEGRS